MSTDASEDDRLRRDAETIVRRLRDHGFEAYFAGGAVRDLLMGAKPKDYDVATSATPDDVARLFRSTVGVGRSFGVMMVILHGEPFQVATFRSEGAYSDGRRPDSVKFSSAEEDVKRRDFTVNGLLLDPVDNRVIDFVGGLADLEAEVIRAIGDPRERFVEDHLRLLRAVRLAARLEFRIDAETANAIAAAAPLAGTPSPERIGEEVRRMFSERDPGRAHRLLRELGLMKSVLPDVDAKFNREPEPRLRAGGHSASLGDRTQRLLDQAGPPMDPLVAFAVVFEDLADVAARPRARRAEALMKQLRFAHDYAGRVAALIVRRDQCLFAPRPSTARRRAARAHPDVGALRDYLALEAAASTNGGRAIDLPTTTEPLPPPLLRGEELPSLGVAPGRAIGRALRRVRYWQLSGAVPDAATARARLRRSHPT